jgi:hypothetical protein
VVILSLEITTEGHAGRISLELNSPAPKSALPATITRETNCSKQRGMIVGMRRPYSISLTLQEADHSAQAQNRQKGQQERRGEAQPNSETQRDRA